MEEKRAIDRLKGGDIGGLETLAEQHYTHAVRTAFLILRDRSLAEDVVQGAFVRAYEKIASFDATRPFTPWFMKIVVNDAVKLASRRERTVSFYQGDTEDLLGRIADPGRSPHELAEEAETSRRVWRALEQLPPAQRAMVVQRYYLGMSEAEMAGSGAVSSGTVKSRLNRARQKLLKLLRPQFRRSFAGARDDRPASQAPVDARVDSLERRINHD